MVTTPRILIACAVAGAVGAPAASAQDTWHVGGRLRGDGVHIRIARSYYLPQNEIARHAVIVIGGSATVEGRLEDDLIAVGGDVRIGPTAHIRGDVVSLGGEVTVADGAEVTGEIKNVSVTWPNVGIALSDWFWRVDRGWWAALSLVGTVFRLMLTLLAAGVVALVAPRWIRRLERSTAEAPVAGWALGLLAQLLFVPALVLTVVALIVTIIGIPLLVLVPFAVAGFLAIWLAGFAGVAAQVGGAFRNRLSPRAETSPVLDTAVGVVLLGLVTVIGNILALGPAIVAPAAAAFGIAGLVIEYLAWTVGLGAALMTPFRHQWRATPPVPAPTASSVTP